MKETRIRKQICFTDEQFKIIKQAAATMGLKPMAYLNYLIATHPESKLKAPAKKAS